MVKNRKYYIGTAGWNVPRHFVQQFPSDGTHLERYSKNFNAVEINSSFYKNHKADTYKKWTDSVPEDFKFSVKLLKIFTHQDKLKIKDKAALKSLLKDLKSLGSKWGMLLVQLPPSLNADKKISENFFKLLRTYYDGPVSLEPRHVSWTEPEILEVFTEYKISKVFADPEKCPSATDCMKGHSAYFRLHGSPVIYKSSYSTRFLEGIALDMKDNLKNGLDSWCIFDNTAYGHGTSNGMELQKILTRLT